MTIRRITSVDYEESVFQASLGFIGKQILYFRVQNWQSGHGSVPDQSIHLPYTPNFVNLRHYYSRTNCEVNN